MTPKTRFEMDPDVVVDASARALREIAAELEGWSPLAKRLLTGASYLEEAAQRIRRLRDTLTLAQRERDDAEGCLPSPWNRHEMGL